MLSKTDSDKIKALGLDVEKLTAAIKAPGEVAIEVPEGKFYSEETMKTRDEVIKNEAGIEAKKEGFKEGKDKGLEIQGQILLKKFGIDTTNIKAIDPDKVAEAIHGATSKGDAGLQEQVKLLMQERDQIRENFESKEKELALKTFDTNLIANMPVKRNTKLFNDTEFLLTLKSNLEFENKDGVVFVKEKGGDYLRDEDTKAQLPFNKALETYFNKRGWVLGDQQEQDNGGRGGKDGLPNGTAGIRTASEFEAAWTKSNPDKTVGQPEYVQALLEAHKTAGAGNFDLNK